MKSWYFPKLAICLKEFVFHFCTKYPHRFIAERGGGGQLRHVENIDEAFNLNPMPAVMGEKKLIQKPDIARPLPLTAQTPRYNQPTEFLEQISSFKKKY